MRQAVRLARLGLGHTAPNPAVGCVIVKDGQARRPALWCTLVFEPSLAGPGCKRLCYSSKSKRLCRRNMS